MNLARLTDPNFLVALTILYLTSFPIHEWAHAWAAYQLGDDTAALQGRLTINPLAHLDPLGAISMVFFGYGWGKPVPVNPYRLRGNARTSQALVAAAGPFSNLVLAMLGAIPFRLHWLNLYSVSTSAIDLSNILKQFIVINLSLMIFNLIPFPPLDGSRVLRWLLPSQWAHQIDRIEQFGGTGLMMLLYFMSRAGILTLIMGPAMDFMIRALFVY
ncbi:MAG: site-2 protease family protein [Chloroflexi bacterium]|nr:site-2 protease family protein [Chloroflexota bacterium]